jgi:carbon monoxide dehydrogenase subunit G
MQLEHDFVVPVSRDHAWDVLMDVERIAPCMPGATFDGFEGDHFLGRVKVKLGPITITYAGKARFVEQDKAAGRAVIDASGKESRGTGTAHAVVTTVLHDRGDSTLVQVVTDLDITGKPAQFGRGVMVDVGAKIIGQFADCLAAQLSAPEAAPATEPAAAGIAGAEPGAAAAPAQPVVLPAQQRPTAEAIDLLDTAGAPLLKRLLPIVGGVVGLWVLWRIVRRGRSESA